ncbi:DUF1801 domain-containing protein [uncultured Algoriphagus sp.]|uniref:DUF1801 domain-containing protein n=1 Tax=uncultured Algoriphagus sp. TaxID=417365 RepID=UPI0030EB1A0B|tara:strand:+ start:10609 stop:11001 length:393 start_codon:yes stop_codon:yes gene_type:complete
MNTGIQEYHRKLSSEDQKICDLLAKILDEELTEAESKIWHAHPVWFLDGNPVAGYSRQKAGIRLMFWSGADFGEEKLISSTGKFKDASIFYNSVEEIEVGELRNWLRKSRDIQWDYKNIVKRKGLLERLK